MTYLPFCPDAPLEPPEPPWPPQCWRCGKFTKWDYQPDVWWAETGHYCVTCKVRRLEEQ